MKYYILKNENEERIVIEINKKNKNTPINIFKIVDDKLVEYNAKVSLKILKKVKKGLTKKENSYDIADCECLKIELNNEQRKKKAQHEINKKTYDLLETKFIDDDDLIDFIKTRNMREQELEDYMTKKKYELIDKKIYMQSISLGCEVIIITIAFFLVKSISKYGLQELINGIKTYPILSAIIAVVGAASIQSWVKASREERIIDRKIEQTRNLAYLYYEKTRNKQKIYETPQLEINSQSKEKETKERRIVMTKFTQENPKLENSGLNTANLSPQNLIKFYKWLEQELYAIKSQQNEKLFQSLTSKTAGKVITKKPLTKQNGNRWKRV